MTISGVAGRDPGLRDMEPPASMPVPKSESNHEDQRPAGRLPLGWMRMYAVVFEFLAYMGGLGYAGWWLDQRRGWEPWGLLAGLLLGTSLGVYRIIRESKHIEQ